MCKVTIIIPLHNGALYIEETLKSCFAQSYPHLEIIVVENSSSDASYEVVQQIADPRLQLYQLESANAAKARNYGFSKSSGDYVMFLDADDVLASQKIELQLKALEQKPTGWLASCAWAKFDDVISEAQVEEQEVWRIEKPLDWLVKAMTGSGMMALAGWLMPRQLIEQAGVWNEHLSLHDDGEFMSRILLASRGQVFVENTVVYYRQLAESLSRQNRSFKAAQSALWVVQSYEKQLLSHEDSATVREALAYQYMCWLYEFYPHYPQLYKQAKSSLRQLQVPLSMKVGGTLFQGLSRWFGFFRALRLLALKRF